jgi:hypothetical protein
MNTTCSESRGGNNGEEQAAAGNGCSVVGAVLGLGGAVVGAFLGYLLFVAIAGQGFYAIVLPGALAGVGCGALSGRKSNTLGIMCGILGLIAGILAEWRFAPFIADKSLFYFLRHIHELPRFTQVMILLGAGFAFWFGRGRKGGAWLRREKLPSTPGDECLKLAKKTGHFQTRA